MNDRPYTGRSPPRSEPARLRTRGSRHVATCSQPSDRRRGRPARRGELFLVRLKSCAYRAGARKRSAVQGDKSPYAYANAATTAYTHIAVAITGPTVRAIAVRLPRTRLVIVANAISSVSPTADAAIVATKRPAVPSTRSCTAPAVSPIAAPAKNLLLVYVSHFRWENAPACPGRVPSRRPPTPPRRSLPRGDQIGRPRTASGRGDR